MFSNMNNGALEMAKKIFFHIFAANIAKHILHGILYQQKLKILVLHTLETTFL